MSTRVTRSRSKQQHSDAGGEPSQNSSDVSTAKRPTVSGLKRKSKNDVTEEKSESEPTLQLEAAEDGDKQAGQQLKLVAGDNSAEETAERREDEQKEGTSKENNGSADKEKREGDDKVDGWQDGHDSDTDYHEPQSPTQLVTLQQTDHRTAGGAPPSLPDDIDLSPVIINRAPVLTLWAAVLAHLGPAHLPWLSALTVGKAIAGMLAQSRGRAIGIYEPQSDRGHKRQKTPEEKAREEHDVQVLGIKVHMARLNEHVVATISNKPVNASQCDRYIHQHFGANRPRVIAAMKYLVHCLLARGADGESDITGRYSFTLYESFRPCTANGQAPGWGQKGELDLRKIVEIGKNELESAKTEGTQLHLTTTSNETQDGEGTKDQQSEK